MSSSTGSPSATIEWEHEAVVGGDALVHSVACASIVAKVCRDRLMTRLARRYPDYGWDRNMGYATRGHRRAVRERGLTPHHRTSFGLLQLELPLPGRGGGVRPVAGSGRRCPVRAPADAPETVPRPGGLRYFSREPVAQLVEQRTFNP